MCVLVRVHAYVCRACTCVMRACACTFARIMLGFVHTNVCVRMRVGVLAYGCMHAWVRACAYAFACVSRFVHARMHVRVCQRTRTCMYKCARACVFTCVSVHTGVRARM